MQKIKNETIAFFNTQQREGMEKLCNDLERYEHKRRVAAHYISDMKRETARLCADNCRLTQETMQLYDDIRELNNKIEDLEAQLNDERETSQELSDQWFEMSGEIKAYKEIILKLI